MSRPLRIEYPDAYYHVMNRGRGRKPIFHDKAYFEAFLATLSEAHTQFGIEIHAYCLMTNHYHLLIKTPLGNLQRAMRHIGGVYTQRYNRLKRTDGALFRGRYKAIVVDSDEYLLHLSKYIHLNPLTARMVDRLEQYAWSSYPAYIKNAKPLAFLSTTEVYAQLGYKSRVAKQYKAYVEEMELDADIVAFYKKQRQAPVLGSHEFITNIRKQVKGKAQDVSRKDKQRIKPSMQSITEAVSVVFKQPVASLKRSQRGRYSENRPRKVLMYLLQQIGDYRLQEIAEFMNLKHYGGVSNAISYVKEWLENEPVLRKKVKSIINRFDP